MNLTRDQFAIDSSTWIGISQGINWDEWSLMPSAKAIGREQWKAAVAVAKILNQACPLYGWPEPGADVAGFPWLTWTNGERRFALAVKPDLTAPFGCSFEWDAVFDGSPHPGKSRLITDLPQALRSTLGEVG